MSVKVMGMVWDLDIRREEKFILLAYADHADHDGTNVFPSINLIAKKTGYHPRSVKRITRLLVEGELLIPDGTGPQGTNKWKIPLDRGGDKIAPPQLGGDTGVTGGVTKYTGGGDIAMSPDSSLTIIKPSEREDSWAQTLVVIQNTYYRGTANKTDWGVYWLSTRFVSHVDGKYQVACKSEDQRVWLEDRGKSIAEKMLRGILKKKAEVEFIVAPG